MVQGVKVSVIVATYRRDKDLGRALDSLARQKFENFEIIVVDDNDNEIWNRKVENIIKDFQEQYTHVVCEYIQNHPNLGSAMARNKGIQMAKGEYITFLDDDDVYLPMKIKRQYEYMVSEKLDYCVTDLNLYFDNGKLLERRTRGYIEKYDRKSLLKYHLMHHMTGTDTMMFKKEYLTDIDGFAPIDIGDEFYLMLRAIRQSGRFGYLKGCDLKAYVHMGEDNLSSGQSKIDGENNLYEYKKRYFHYLDRKTVCYIKMRHYAVLAFAEIRRKRYVAFIKNGIQSFLSSPIGCIKLLIKI